MSAMRSNVTDKRRKALADFMKSRRLKVYPWCQAAGVSEAAVRLFLKGRTSSLNDATYSKLAAAANVTVSDLMGETTPRSAVPVFGYAGAGERVEPVDGDDPPMIDTVEGPPGMKDPAALIVRGDSMRPMFFDGDTIFFEKRELQPEQVLGRACIVRVKDGPLFVKQLMRGSRRGRFHLVSVNQSVAPIEDQPVVWVAKIKWVKRLDD